MESLWKYYGVDWIGILFSMFSTYLLGKKRKRGFLVGMAGNLAFMGFGIMAGSAANVVANGIYFILNARGWLCWRKEPPKKAGGEDPGMTVFVPLSGRLPFAARCSAAFRKKAEAQS